MGRIFLKLGIHNLYFDLSNEPISIKKFLKNDKLDSDELKIRLKVRVSAFGPIHSNNGYHDSLIQILDLY